MQPSEVLRRKQPRRRSLRLLLDEALLQRRDEIVSRISQAERREAAIGGGDWSSPIPALRDELAEVDLEIDDNTVEFVFEAMPRRKWYELVEEYKEELDAGMPPEGFQRQVVVLSALDPKWTEADVDEIFETWGTWEVDQIYLTAFAVNREVRNIPFTEAGTRQIPSTGSNSTTSQNEESPTQNS